MYQGTPGSCFATSKTQLDSYLMTYSFYDLSGATPLSPTQFLAGATTQEL